ncbi:MAG: TRAP transporter small permease, partial [Pseudorhodoplanes sp.]
TAWGGGGLAVVMVAVIVWDVLLRAFGFQPPDWTTAFIEYALLYMTLLAAPWLVRERANVAIDTFTNMLPNAWRIRLDWTVCLLCAALSLILFVFGSELTATAWRNGDQDIRSIPIPFWIFYIGMPVSFAFVGMEFLLLPFRQRRSTGGRSTEGH